MPKPGDHPEFFRFPAPPGRSRESSIRLDAQGRFWHDGALVEHLGMARAFARWITRHPDDGRYILSNGYDWTYFEVEGAPFFVLGVIETPGAASVAAGLVLDLSDGSSEPLRPETLSVGRDNALYAAVKGGEFRARFTPFAQTGLAPWLVTGPNGRNGLELGGRFYPIVEGDSAGLAPAAGKD